jgi:Ca-activated chloride channel family protein
MSMAIRKPGTWINLPIFAVLAVSAYLFFAGKVSLLTPDQQAYRSYARGEFAVAAERFSDPMWIGVALFRQGEFEKSAETFVGVNTVDAAFNQGNSLLMLGQYDAAATRYSRALELRPEWDASITNREIALARAAMLKQEGGDMTGGMLGADDIVFTKGQSPPGGGDEVTDEAAAKSDEELRAIWLRQVQTKPADFLAAKFAYQQAMRSTPGDSQELAQ